MTVPAEAPVAEADPRLPAVATTVALVASSPEGEARLAVEGSRAEAVDFRVALVGQRLAARPAELAA